MKVFQDRMLEEKPIEVSDSPELRGAEDLTLSSAAEWSTWLAEQQRVALEVYGIKPRQLVADQRREQGISRDYKGREVLELLQNAADAAKKAGQLGRIRIELTSLGLIIANTGLCFSTGGVSSLQTADLSPKRGKNSQLIGSKGLGFRSVLNWSRQPMIISGALQLTFSNRYAHFLIEQLKNQHVAVREELSKHKRGDNVLVPLLPFPVDLTKDELSGYVEDKALFEYCKTLGEDGFETIIAMPFDSNHSYDNALNQLSLLRPEFLLFTDSIKSLSVSVKGKSDNDSWTKEWSSEVISEELVDLTEHDFNHDIVTCKRWQLFRKVGEIPTHLLSDSDDPSHYHLVVAIQDEGLAEPTNLYSFFPTSIPLPIHALCHASLELEQNRKHLQESEANVFVLESLALFLADIFEQQADKSGDAYRALDLLQIPSILQDYQLDIKPLQTALIDALKTRNILPVLSGDRQSVSEVMSFKSVDWLPKMIFPEIVMARNAMDKRLFDLISIKPLEATQFVKRLQAATNITLEQRAAVVTGIINQNLDSDYCYKGLLLDTQGNKLSEDDIVYLPGGSLREGVVFPEWAKVKILNDRLWGMLRGNKVRDSAKALSAFGVHEYALGNLITNLVSSANVAVEMLNEYQVRSALLQSLFALFSLYNNDEDRPEFPKRSSAFLLNQIGEWVSANQLYFATGYSSRGNIVSRLYKSVPSKLTAAPSTYEAMNIQQASLPIFLAWLGVEEWPREVESKRVESDFLAFVKQRLKYPAVFIENTTYVFDSANELPINCKFESVKSLDDIDAIVSSESDAILAWLANDPRTISWLQTSESHGTLSFCPPRAWNARIYQGEMPSYIHWKIKYSPWLHSSEGKSLAPVDCMVNDAAVAGLFPRPVLPSKEQMVELNLTHSQLKHAWLNAGVRENIDDLNSEEIYALFAELPDKDPTGDLAKKLYNWLIKTIDFELDETGYNYKTYSETGKIFAKLSDEQGYFPVSEVYHVDVEGFPQELLKSIPVASLLKKRGTSKVQRLFRVNVLDKEAVNEQVINHSVAACTEQANKHFQLAKRYIEIYRHSHFAKAPGRNIFERLQLIVCDQIQSQITFNQEILNNPLPAWTYSIQDDLLYVRCNPINAHEPYNPLLANTIGEAIASIFGLNDGDSFSKIYQCDEKSRAELLSKMLGDDLNDDLDIMLQELINEATDQTISEHFVTMGPVPEVALPEPSTPLTPKPKIEPVDVKPSTREWNVPSDIDIEPVDHEPKVPGNRIGVRISSGGGSSSKPEVSASSSDGTAGEKLAMLFEEKQGRYPLYIGHITGYETIAADIISFRNAEDRTMFESGENQSSSLIERVIEAKEKKTGGSVKLTANEVNTAAAWKGKYYIYRFSPVDMTTAEYELKILKNPLSQLEAVASSIEISLDMAITSQQFRVFDVNA